jgi:pimeloyl-ACP methyl ester carboxylesterase
MASFDHDIVIIGSGFGGSVAALRAAEKGYRVGVMESGRRWKDEDIPRTQWDLPSFLWLPAAELYGIQRIEPLDDVLILSGAGVGGGSHVYANTLYVPPKQFFDAEEWAGITDWADELAPCIDQATRMLGVVRYPYMPTDVDRVLQQVAIDMVQRPAPLVRAELHRALLADDRHLDRAVGLFASVIVGTGGAAVPLQLGEPLASWVLDPDLDKYRRMDPRAIVDTAVDTIAGGISDDIRDDYRASYDGDRFAESMRYVRRYPEELPALAELLSQITTRVTIINGRHDRVVQLANAEFLDERLPNSRLAIIDAGHFVWEEAPAEYASIILDSITAGS